jgi:hypothetical protein
MKIVEFFLIIWGKWSEPEPEFLTSWSRSRTKMDRLRNTAFNETDFAYFVSFHPLKGKLFFAENVFRPVKFCVLHCYNELRSNAM